MKNMKMVKTIFFTLFFIIAASLAYGESYNGDAYYKDYVTLKDNNVVIAVNRDTYEVELYWSEQDNTWLKPDVQYKKELQKKYDKKIQLLEMQQNMDRMSRDSWYNKNQSSGRVR